jgi:N-acetylneuraminic acid mutarotase
MIMDHQMVVFGGVKSNKYQRTVSVLDTNRWKWTSPPKIMGDAPRPRSYHSATTVKKGDQKDWIVVVGGNDHDTCFNTVHVLEVNDGRWSWINPIMSGDLPSPRTGHAATLMEDGKTIFIQGGWDPNAEDEEEIIYEDCFLLDTSTWTWTKSEKTVERALVGHKAVQCKNEVHMFGGRLAGGKFSNDLLTLSLD